MRAEALVGLSTNGGARPFTLRSRAGGHAESARLRRRAGEKTAKSGEFYSLGRVRSLEAAAWETFIDEELESLESRVKREMT